MFGTICQSVIWALVFPDSPVVKNLPANAVATTDMGSIPGSGRSPGERNGSHSNILSWEIPWTEEPDGLQSRRGHKRVGRD